MSDFFFDINNKGRRGGEVRDDDDDDCLSPSLLMSRLLSSVGVMVRCVVSESGGEGERTRRSDTNEATDRRIFCNAKLLSSTGSRMSSRALSTSSTRGEGGGQGGRGR